MHHRTYFITKTYFITVCLMNTQRWALCRRDGVHFTEAPCKCQLRGPLEHASSCLAWRFLGAVRTRHSRLPPSVEKIILHSAGPGQGRKRRQFLLVQCRHWATANAQHCGRNHSGQGSCARPLPIREIVPVHHELIAEL